MPAFVPSDEDFEFLGQEPPNIDVEITDPKVLGELLGPKGEVIATLVDRPIVEFGYRGHAAP